MKIIINTDGGARGNPGPAGIGVVICDDSGNILEQHKKYIGTATNNIAEYQALILALQKAALKYSHANLEVRMDSELVVKQIKGLYKIKEPGLKLLSAQVFDLIKIFPQTNFVHVRRELNKAADKLVNEAIDELVT